MTGAPTGFAKMLAALGAAMHSDVGAALRPTDIGGPKGGRVGKSKKSKRTRRWHASRAVSILANSGKTGGDYDAWFAHLAYGAARPATPHPNARAAARR